MSKSQAQTMNNNHQHLMEEREKYNAKLKNWKTREEVQEADKKTCRKLQHLFHMAMELGFIHTLMNREAMMNYLNKRGNPDWTAGYIWGLADSNKIDWVKGSSDPMEYETYKAKMNKALAKYVCPE